MRYDAPSAPMPPDVIGKTVSHYQVIEVLGAGGMGVVYKAKDLRLRRYVALKFVSTPLAEDPVALRQFEREARTASVTQPSEHLHDLRDGRVAGNPFIVMELLDGQTIKQRLGDGPLDVPHHHRHGRPDRQRARRRPRKRHHPSRRQAGKHLHHREGPVKLLDFGLAKEGTLAPARSRIEHRIHRGRPHARHRELHGARAAARARSSITAATCSRSAPCSTR